ncbi:protein of unknown function DUF1730 [Bacteroides coprosuis DSM 18011]|uniref:4Fe-4S ferredoxin-type domain-containing protein n=1 Tax=Bacteroides coprosuis DSM 18011 TaxID=679937 RepID=F3ZQH2_9BACE|nr:tRNA epoxyqueuosine(34) reductase QueG [Bacteroides coprosuis]EGJ70550.1 protein of unknown function DUF1730 [Bacteroides coprosuis DSM 18011]
MSLNYSKKELTHKIKSIAIELGFSACGVAKAEKVDSKITTYFQNWIEKGYHADMDYLANYYDKRMDPQILVPGTKSIISLALNYYPEKFIPEKEYQIAWYAYGKDYHFLIKDKLTQLFKAIHDITPIEGRVFCDTAPVLERYWAWKAGLGWIGKNTQLIIPHAGSSFFLGELFINLDLEYDTPQPDRCGNCNKCLVACPTNALQAPRIMNANKCISYQTIENRGEIDSHIIPLLENKIYGCDDCIKVCPWTRFSQPTTIKEFAISNELLNMTKEKWSTLSVQEYQELFRKSAVKRAKFSGIQRNINAVHQRDPFLSDK